jgi:hypothetical protein
VGRLLVVAILAAALAVAAAVPAEARSGAFEAKPSGIVCGAFRIGQRAATVRCDLRFIGQRAAFLHRRGKARIQHVSAFLHPRHPKTVRRGHEIHFGAFTCRSLPAAVTCRSSNGNGFTVGKKFQLTF